MKFLSWGKDGGKWATSTALPCARVTSRLRRQFSLTF